LQREPPVASARPGRGAAPLRSEIEEPPVERVAELRVQEAAAVADRGVVNLELVPVIAKRERLAQAAVERREAREAIDPLAIVEIAEAYPISPRLISKAHDRLRERRRLHRIEEPVAERGRRRDRLKPRRNRHDQRLGAKNASTAA